MTEYDLNINNHLVQIITSYWKQMSKMNVRTRVNKRLVQKQRLLLPNHNDVTANIQQSIVKNKENQRNERKNYRKNNIKNDIKNDINQYVSNNVENTIKDKGCIKRKQNVVKFHEMLKTAKFM